MEITKKHLGDCKNEGIICAPQLVGNANRLNKLKRETGCKTEQCVVVKKFGKQAMEKYWKPFGPQDEEWLSNFDIDDVLKWWADKHKKFKHIGFQTIDFMEYPTELRGFSMCANDGKCAGVVINTDVRTGQGLHWFCLFMDMRKRPYTIEYFNSEGSPPPDAVRHFCYEQSKLCQSQQIPCEVIIASSIRHQYGQSECGPYSLYYIYSRIKNTPYTKFGMQPIPDAYMRRFRKALFRDHKL